MQTVSAIFMYAHRYTTLNFNSGWFKFWQKEILLYLIHTRGMYNIVGASLSKLIMSLKLTMLCHWSMTKLSVKSSIFLYAHPFTNHRDFKVAFKKSNARPAIYMHTIIKHNSARSQDKGLI